MDSRLNFRMPHEAEGRQNNEQSARGISDRLVDYEKKGKRDPADKIIQVNALGDLIDDINGDLDII